MGKGSDKAPAYQWFPKDAETDEAYRLMTCEELGVYERLRDHQWLEGSLPSLIESLALIVGHGMTKHRLEKIWPKIAPCFPAEASGRLANPKLERQRQALAAYVAERKLSGSRGGKQTAENRSSASSSPIKELTAISSSPSASAFPKRESKEHSLSRAQERAGRLREELYPAWYAEFRNGARLKLIANPLEYQEAVRICETWEDARIAQIAKIVLTTDDDWISRTDRGFRIFCLKATWADERLCQWEHQHGVKAS